MRHGGGGGVERAVLAGGFDGDSTAKDGPRSGGDGGRRRETRRSREDVARDGVVRGAREHLHRGIPRSRTGADEQDQGSATEFGRFRLERPGRVARGHLRRGPHAPDRHVEDAHAERFERLQIHLRHARSV